MTSQSPRIYTYKITFEEVPYYYYGVKKEKYYNQEYWGSPKTHKWCWELYTPKKQVLELFDYSDEGWLEAQEVEKRLIAPVFNTDKWCLNESCGGKISLAALRSSGKEAGMKAKKNKTGIFALSPEQMSENGRKNGIKNYENGIGIFSRSKEEMIEHGRKSGLKCKEKGTGVCGQSLEKMKENGKKAGMKAKENKTGIFALSPEQIKENSRKSGIKNYEKGVGIFARSKEKMTEHGRKGGLKCKENGTGIFTQTEEERKELGRKSCAQKWKCLETGHIANPGNLTIYQRKRGIDTTKRERVS